MAASPGCRLSASKGTDDLSIVGAEIDNTKKAIFNLVGLVLFLMVRAQGGAPGENVQALIRQLGSDRVEIRQAAQEKLRAYGTICKKELDLAVGKEEDPEVRESLEALLKVIKLDGIVARFRGILPKDIRKAEDLEKAFPFDSHGLGERGETVFLSFPALVSRAPVEVDREVDREELMRLLEVREAVPLPGLLEHADKSPEMASRAEAAMSAFFFFRDQLIPLGNLVGLLTGEKDVPEEVPQVDRIEVLTLAQARERKRRRFQGFEKVPLHLRTSDALFVHLYGFGFDYGFVVLGKNNVFDRVVFWWE